MTDTVAIAAPAGGLDRLAQLFSDEHGVTARTIADQRDKLTVLELEVRSLRSDMTRASEKVEDLVGAVTERAKPNYAMLLSMGLLVPILAAFLLYVITTQVSQATTPMNVRVASLEAKDITRDQARTDQIAFNSTTARDLTASGVADVTSRTDRAQMNVKLDALDRLTANDASERRGQLAEITARLLEVEQQFANVSNIMNMRAAEQNRINAMNYEKLHPGERYPDNSFFPTSVFSAPPPPLAAPK